MKICVLIALVPVLLSACGGGGQHPAIGPAAAGPTAEDTPSEQQAQLIRIETGPDGVRTAFILTTPGLTGYGDRDFVDTPLTGLQNIHLGAIGTSRWRATLTFELPELPSDVRIVSARLHVVPQVTSPFDDPFDPLTGVGRVVVDHVEARASLFTSRDPELHSLPALEGPVGGVHNPDVLIGSFDRSTDVTQQVRRDVERGRAMSQFRFRCENDHLANRSGNFAFSILAADDNPLFLELRFHTFTVDAPSPGSADSPVRPVIGGLR